MPRALKLPGQRLRKLATSLLKFDPLHSFPKTSAISSSYPLRVVCISDTHNTQPGLPPGDILIHTGDLTMTGTIKELQAQLTWLSSQSNSYKIVVAGNHDVCLDEALLEKRPQYKRREAKTLHDLDWGSVHYLQDTSVQVEFPLRDSNKHQEPRKQRATRTLSIYGSLLTPQYGVSAFQYPREQDIWTGKISSDTDVVVTHGPPRLHLDARDFYRAGCPYLAQAVSRLRPRLVVFGHIHAAYGREDVVLDAVQQAYEEIINARAGWGALAWMAAGVALRRIKCFLWGKERIIRDEKVTTFVNASVVGGRENELRNRPIVVELYLMEEVPT